MKSKQQGDGSWSGNESKGESDVQATCMAVLFLVRGTKLLIPTYLEILEGGAQDLPDKGPVKLMKRGREPADHWIVRYATNGKRNYAKQLDYFRIEIGSISKDTQRIEYASRFSESKPRLRSGTRKDEHRAFFQKPEDHPALKWDKSFLKTAGARIDAHEVRNFYPAAVYREMLQLEQQAVLRDSKKITDVQRAIFSIRSRKDGGYEFRLVNIRYKLTN